MRTYVKIIHGSVNILRSRSKQLKWIDELETELRLRGIYAFSFYWSGIPYHAFLEKTAHKLSVSILNDLYVLSKERKWTTNDRICIISKSLSSEIVERALETLIINGCKISVDVLLRLAPPFFSRIPNTKCVVNIIAKNDYFALFGGISSHLFRPKSTLSNPHVKVITIKMKDFNHHNLNRNHLIHTGKYSDFYLYDVYEKFILGCEP